VRVLLPDAPDDDVARFLRQAARIEVDDLTGAGDTRGQREAGAYSEHNA
jgi:hypothetical protein